MLIGLLLLALAFEEPPAHAASLTQDQRVRDVGPLQINICSTWPAKSYNRLLKRRAEIGGKSPKKWASRPVCVRPHVRRVQAQINNLLRICRDRGDPACRWLKAWNRLSPYDRQWTIGISSCEVRAVWPDLIAAAKFNNGNGFHGAFQWLISTWQSAGGSGSPVTASWHEQAVRAVAWRNKEGTMQWPACSRSRGYA